MSKIPFTDEQMKLLKNNPYTYHVTPNTLYFTKEFKELFYNEYQEGKLPRAILEEHGYPADVLGERRIWGIGHSIKKQANRPEGFSEGSNISLPTERMSAKDSPEEAIQHLQTEVEYLRQEVEYLKKISSIKNTRK